MHVFWIWMVCEMCNMLYSSCKLHIVHIMRVNPLEKFMMKREVFFKVLLLLLLQLR